ncbi:hypothetical protein [Burkholderia ubonensis]|uniref:hypothetical protein n=1 Tax=Burkholderia ubonensis TaxID=101571 RepID=UPI000AE42833|nr:hypothetical protein [Burkholderia ubonensis]
MNEQHELTIDESNQIEELLDEWCAWQSGYAPCWAMAASIHPAEGSRKARGN